MGSRGIIKIKSGRPGGIGSRWSKEPIGFWRVREAGSRGNGISQRKDKWERLLGKSRREGRRGRTSAATSKPNAKEQNQARKEIGRGKEPKLEGGELNYSRENQSKHLAH